MSNYDYGYNAGIDALLQLIYDYLSKCPESATDSEKNFARYMIMVGDTLKKK